jgi:hypothetical protein
MTFECLWGDVTIEMDSSSDYGGGGVVWGVAACVCLSAVQLSQKTQAQNGTDVERTENVGLRRKSIIMEPRGEKLENKRRGDPNVWISGIRLGKLVVRRALVHEKLLLQYATRVTWGSFILNVESAALNFEAEL